MNLKNNSDCPFGPMIGQRHKSSSNGPRQTLPTQGLQGGFRRFSSRLHRTGNEWFFKTGAVKVSISNSPKNWGETGIFAEDDAGIKDTGQQK